MPTLRAVGGAGGVGAARLRREYDRPAKHVDRCDSHTDTALTKAGVAREVKKSDITPRAIPSGR